MVVIIGIMRYNEMSLGNIGTHWNITWNPIWNGKNHWLIYPKMYLSIVIHA
jgi:hypothetical protein